MQITLMSIATFFYFAALFQVIPGLSGTKQIPAKSVFISAAIALAIHALVLFEQIFANTGLNLSMLNVASLISLIISATISAAMFKIRIWMLLPVVYSFSVINLCAAVLLPSSFITHFENHPATLIHIVLALFSYATLMIATLYAIQLAWLDHQLKNKEMAINPNLPPLMMVERQLFTIILIGELLLSVTLITGFAFVNDVFAEGKAHKAILSAMAWLVYAGLLWGHYRKGWRGKPVIWVSIIGAFLLTLGYFGSRFVQEVIIAS